MRLAPLTRVENEPTVSEHAKAIVWMLAGEPVEEFDETEEPTTVERPVVR
jgi:hypothetical protein